MEPPKIIHTHSQLNLEKDQPKAELILRGLLAGIVVLAIAAGALWWLLQERQSLRGMLANLQPQVTFPLFYPAQLPAGMSFDKKVSSTKDVVTTSFTYDNDKHLVVTLQSTGNGFNPGAFNPTSEFTTTIGQAYMADLPTRTTAAVVGEKSWVLINAPSKIAVDRLTAFINSLRPL